MRNNNIQDEDFGKEIPDPNKATAETPWIVSVIAVVIAACIATVIIALTLRLDKWLLR